MPNEQVHALFHLIVENQAALRDETPVAATLERLVHEDGLDRHEAIHAVASVMPKYVWDILQSNEQTPDAYFDEVRTMTVEKWISEFGE